MTEGVIETVDLNRIVATEEAQPRVTLDFAMVQEFAEDMIRGDDFPPIDVFFDGETHWLADGFHRFHAALGLSLESIPCRVHQGDLDDAIWFSLQANRSNGVRRTRQDVQNAVRRALVHRNGYGQADQWIGTYVGCDGKTVNVQRQLLIAKSEIPTSQSRVDRNGVERVAPQPRAASQPEATAAGERGDPRQIDLEDYPGVKQPQPGDAYFDRSNDWLHAELKTAIRALQKLPDPKTTVDLYPHSLGYVLPVRDIEAALDWLMEFAPLWTGRFPEFQAYYDKMARVGQETAREHVD